jgi:RimJ/RimL family protein N-acetyltransferase
LPNRHPPYRLETERLVIRCWNPDDAPLLKAAVDRNVEHLLRYMGWIAHEPTTVEAKFELLRQFRGKFDLDQDYTYGIFNKAETQVLGGTGLHRRGGGEALEIGYWIDKDHVGKGLATEVAAKLTEVALCLNGVDRVEIRHEPSNLASSRVPEKLGYTREALLRRVNDHFEGELRDSVVWVKFQ